MSTKTPEQRASERWPDNIVNEYGSTSSDGQLGARIGCATAIRELVEPRDRLLQEAVDAITHCAWQTGERAGCDHAMSELMYLSGYEKAFLAKAKEQFGITPTNQK